MKRLINSLNRIGSAGALIAAISAPCCFPIFAAASTALGLGVIGQYESAVLYLFQTFAVLSVIGLVFAFRRHRHATPTLIGLGSLGALAYHFHWRFSFVALYTGLFGLLVATVWNHFCSREPQAVLRSVVTCPKCGHRAEETMPTNACLFFYDCAACGERMKPLAGDCCIFCSYGSVPCPPIQIGTACCA